MYEFENLNYDLNMLIDIHLKSMIIQNYFRRFTSRDKIIKVSDKWKVLRVLLLTQLSVRDFSILSVNTKIIKEWNNEPESWIYMLTNCKGDLVDIMSEVKMGFW